MLPSLGTMSTKPRFTRSLRLCVCPAGGKVGIPRSDCPDSWSCCLGPTPLEELRQGVIQALRDPKARELASNP